MEEGQILHVFFSLCVSHLIVVVTSRYAVVFWASVATIFAIETRRFESLKYYTKLTHFNLSTFINLRQINRFGHFPNRLLQTLYTLEDICTQTHTVCVHIFLGNCFPYALG